MHQVGYAIGLRYWLNKMGYPRLIISGFLLLLLIMSIPCEHQWDSHFAWGKKKEFSPISEYVVCRVYEGPHR